jgi:hypothetical protein
VERSAKPLFFFLEYFKDFPDSRQLGKVIYLFDEVLLLYLLAVLAGAETFVDIARFGEKKLDLLRRFRPFCHGTSSHDHLGDILATFNAEEFQRCFVAWVAGQTGALAQVDGAGWHVASELVIPANITLIHLPSNSPELNPVENVREYLRKNKLALRIHNSYDAIVDACCQAWNDLMAMPDRIASIAGAAGKVIRAANIKPD